MKNFYSLTLLLCLCTNLAQADISSSQVKKLIKAQDYSELGSHICDTYSSLQDLEQLTRIADITKCKPLQAAIGATNALFSTNSNLGITRQEFLQTALYILTTPPENSYLPQEITGLKDPLEYDPDTNQTFIILDRHKEAYVGRGSKKMVHKCILFDVKHPKVLARATQTLPINRELGMYRDLQGAPGVIQMHAFTLRTEGDTTHSTLYLDLYEPGSLRQILATKKRFSLREKAEIMAKLLHGVESFHSNGLVHLDLHIGNCLVSLSKDSKGNKTIATGIADLGRAMTLEQAKGVRTQGATFFQPPEGWSKTHLEGKDYHQSDLYALGCVFYQLFYNKQPSWQGEYLKNSSLTNDEKQQKLIQKLDAACKERRLELQAQKESKGCLSCKKALELLVLEMVDVDPAKRGSTSTLRLRAEEIASKIK